MKTRPVVMQFTVKMVVDMPQEWTQDEIEFFVNESSACQSRYYDQLSEEINAEPNSCNICSRSEGRYLREATPDDIQMMRPAARERAR